MKRSKLLLAAAIIITGFYSCQNNEPVSENDETTVTISDDQLEKDLSEIDMIVENNIAIRSAGDSTATNECPVVTVDKKVKPVVMTIDYGDACTGKDGKVRSGKIIVKTENISRFSSSKNKTFDNFYINGRKIEGLVTKAIVKDTASKSITSIVTEDVTITYPEEGFKAYRKANLTRINLRNNVTDKLDDKVISWGNIETTRTNGVVVQKTITQENPLIYSAECSEIVSGIANFKSSLNKEWSIDYGNGDCDNQATITRNGVSKIMPI